MSNKAKCPDCKLLFETSFDRLGIKICPCCEYSGPSKEFICTEEEWLKKKEFKKTFLSSFKRSDSGKDNKLKNLKSFKRKESK